MTVLKPFINDQRVKTQIKIGTSFRASWNIALRKNYVCRQENV